MKEEIKKKQWFAWLWLFIGVSSILKASAGLCIIFILFPLLDISLSSLKAPITTIGTYLMIGFIGILLTKSSYKRLYLIEK